MCPSARIHPELWHPQSLTPHRRLSPTAAEEGSSRFTFHHYFNNKYYSNVTWSDRNITERFALPPVCPDPVPFFLRSEQLYCHLASAVFKVTVKVIANSNLSTWRYLLTYLDGLSNPVCRLTFQKRQWDDFGTTDELTPTHLSINTFN